MKWKIDKKNRIKLVLYTTFITVALAVGLDIVVSYLLHHTTMQAEDLIRAALIPAIITPFLSWSFLGVFLEQKKLKQQMTLLATYDDLTKLYNRRSFYQLSEKVHATSVRNKQSYCLLSVDLDGFKKINDTYGHPCGDKVLSIFSQVANKTVRDSDIVSRLGGDEFCFFLPNTETQQAEILAERLRDKVRTTPALCGSNYVKYNISIGISSHTGDKDISFEDMIRQSDIALYQAKEKGGNQTHCFTKN